MVLSRANAVAGGYAEWKGRKTMVLKASDIWQSDQPATAFTGVAAKSGKVFLAASDPRITSDDVLDWKLIVAAKKDSLLAQAIMTPILQANPNCAGNSDALLAGKMTPEQALNIGGSYSFAGYFYHSCEAAIEGKALSGDGKGLTDVVRQPCQPKGAGAVLRRRHPPRGPGPVRGPGRRNRQRAEDLAPAHGRPAVRHPREPRVLPLRRQGGRRHRPQDWLDAHRDLRLV